MHFAAGVIIPTSVTKKREALRVRRAVAKLLAGFGEDFKLKPHLTDCDCITESISCYKKKDPRYGKPNPSCDECKGSGQVKTTYNEYACFDWWQIGGQWDGAFATRTSESSILWRNCILVKELPKAHSFFAIVTPDQQWHEQWQFMGPKISEKKEIALWNKYQHELLKKYVKNLVVLVDCHR